MKLKRYKDFINEAKQDQLIYEGDFRVTDDMIQDGKLIKDKIPDVITGNFHCSNKKLTTLEGSPKIVGGYFDFGYNKLTGLQGAPKEVGGHFLCRYNKLTSLQGAPEKVGGEFESLNNKVSLAIEEEFIKSGAYKDNYGETSQYGYWKYLLNYMMKENIPLEEVEGWPEGFLNDNIKKSVKGVDKYKL